MDGGHVPEVEGRVTLGNKLDPGASSHEVTVVGEVAKSQVPMEIMFSQTAESGGRTIRSVPWADLGGFRGRSVVRVQGEEGGVFNRWGGKGRGCRQRGRRGWDEADGDVTINGVIELKDGVGEG